MNVFKIADSKIGPKEQKVLKLIEYPEWLTRELLRITNNYSISIYKSIDLDDEGFKDIAMWASITKPDLSGRKLEDVSVEALAFMKRKKELEAAKKYVCKNVIYNFKDGWTVIDITEDRVDLTIEKEIFKINQDKNEDTSLYDTYDSGYTAFHLDDPSNEHNVKFFSLRDPENIPHATIEMTFDHDTPEKLFVREVFSKDPMIIPDYQKLHPQKDKIKEFLQALPSMGYKLGKSPEDYQDKVKVSELKSQIKEDQFGLPYEFYGIGGDADTYRQNIEEAESEGWKGNYFYKSVATNIIDELVEYAKKHDQLDELSQGLEMYENGYETGETSKSGHKIMNYGLMGRFNDYVTDSGLNYVSEDDAPEEKDFMIQPDPNQQSLPGIPTPVPVLDKEAYEEAMQGFNEKLKKYEEEYKSLEENFEPYEFAQYAYKTIQDAIKQGKKPKKKEVNKNKKAGKMIQIMKIAEMKGEIPDGESLALQIQVLKMHLKDNPKLDKSLAELIQKMPAPRQVRQNFSRKECEILYETVEFLWKKMTGTKLVPEKNIQKAPETLQGNYWLLRNGVLLHGLNHYSIAKANTNLICSLLDIGGWLFQEYMSGQPNNLIYLIIKHGGVRLFINKDRKFYAQCSSETYGKWGRNKIRKLDFKKKIVKIIDLRAKYLGWKSGISVIL